MKFVQLDLLLIDIINEIGFKRVPQEAVDEFFEIVKKCQENGSITIATTDSMSTANKENKQCKYKSTICN